jgi:hypothetical protein
MTYTYKHTGKRIWMNDGNKSTQYQIACCQGTKLTLRLLHDPDCQDECCSRSRDTLSRIISKHPNEMIWVDEGKYVFVITPESRFDEDGWSEMSEVSMALALAEYFEAERFDIWPD